MRKFQAFLAAIAVTIAAAAIGITQSSGPLSADNANGRCEIVADTRTSTIGTTGIDPQTNGEVEFHIPGFNGTFYDTSGYVFVSVTAIKHGSTQPTGHIRIQGAGNAASEWAEAYRFPLVNSGNVSQGGFPVKLMSEPSLIWTQANLASGAVHLEVVVCPMG